MSALYPLYPTKTRLALLYAIGADEVIYRDGEYHQANGDARDLKVTARATELQAEGWIELAPRVASVFRSVRPTEVGYELLAKHFPELWGDEAMPPEVTS